MNVRSEYDIRVDSGLTIVLDHFVICSLSSLVLFSGFSTQCVKAEIQLLGTNH